jgi:hypothetical protein
VLFNRDHDRLRLGSFDEDTVHVMGSGFVAAQHVSSISLRVKIDQGNIPPTPGETDCNTRCYRSFSSAPLKHCDNHTPHRNLLINVKNRRDLLKTF